MLLTITPAFAAPLTATKIISGDEMMGSDGTTLKLLAIKAPAADRQALADNARDYLAALTANRRLVMSDVAIDRYGRTAAIIYAVDDKNRKTDLPIEMLKAGFAFVYPPDGDEAQLDEMLRAESDARKNKRGLWAESDYADLPPEKAEAHYGQFAFVSGKVLHAARVKNMVYLNFGDDWRKDFTIAIAAHDLHFFRKAAIDPLDYEGKTVRVRGWIKRDYGPMVTVTHPAQIEVME